MSKFTYFRLFAAPEQLLHSRINGRRFLFMLNVEMKKIRKVESRMKMAR
jgi:hypothetical protein